MWSPAVQGHWLVGVQTSSFTNVCCKGNCQSPMCASTRIWEIQFLKRLHCLRRAWAESTLGFLSKGQEATFVSVSELMLIHPKAGEGNVYKNFTVVATHTHLPGTCAVLTGLEVQNHRPTASSTQHQGSLRCGHSEARGLG